MSLVNIWVRFENHTCEILPYKSKTTEELVDYLEELYQKDTLIDIKMLFTDAARRSLDSSSTIPTPGLCFWQVSKEVAERKVTFTKWVSNIPVEIYKCSSDYSDMLDKKLRDDLNSYLELKYESTEAIRISPMEKTLWLKHSNITYRHGTPIVLRFGLVNEKSI